MVYFREITETDVPHLKKMTQDIWEGNDYVPERIESWLKNADAIHIGMFTIPETPSNSIIGFTRIRKYPNGTFWLEAGRIDPQHQRKGYGKEMTNYAIQYALDQGAQRIQYDTWASPNEMHNPNIEQNHGSIALAQHFNFKRKDYVDALNGEIEKIEFPPDWQKNIHKPLSKDQVLLKFHDVTDEKHTEINHGWNYIPAKESIITNLKDHVTWWQYNRAIVQAIQYTENPIVEGPDKEGIWLIAYGTPKDAAKLIYSLIFSKIAPDLLKMVSIYCEPRISQELLPFGFEYFEGDQTGVMLFEKQDNSREKTMIT